MTPADPRGHERLRAALASMLSSTRGLPVTAENVLILRSIQQAIDLAARTLLAPGDVVAVEAFGFPPAWTALKMAGARLVPVPLDEEGLDVGALEKLLVAEPIRAVFLTPHHQVPTGRAPGGDRRAGRRGHRVRTGRAVRGRRIAPAHAPGAACLRRTPRRSGRGARAAAGGALRFRLPEGGLAIWAEVDPSIDLPA
jgi:DNA-binding transcriptional MocR family regulator